MVSYKYVVRDLAGQRKEGYTRATSATEALSQLREQGFTPVSVNEISTRAKKARRLTGRGRVRSGELSAVFWQLTTMIEGGITVTEALDGIAEDLENAKLKKILQQVLGGIQRGQTFSDSISMFPNVFDKLSCALILAGETGGNLGAALRRVAEYYTNRDRLARKVKKALAYPAFVFGFVVLIVTVIMVVIIPRFREIFDQFGAGQLPAFTRSFMAFYDTLIHQGHFILLGILLLLGLTYLIFRTKKGHYMFSRLVLRLPLFGRLLKQAFLARFCRTMSTLLKGGVPVLEVFDNLAEMTSNDVTRSAIERTRAHIVGGSNIALSMTGTGFFPNLVVRMVRAGEDSGSLWKTLDRTADYYEEKVDAQISTITSLLEPMMIIIVGAIVLVVVIALYLPIFHISDIRGG